MAKRTPEEVEAEIAKLEELKPKIVHYSRFGDNNRQMVQAQIKALRDGWSERDAERFYSEEEDLGLLDNACEAIRWRDGQIEEAPSEAWLPLVEE